MRGGGVSRSRRPMKPAQWRRSKGWACTCFWCTSPQFNGIESMPVRRATADAIGDLVAEATEDHSFWDSVELEERYAEQCYDEWLLLPVDDEPLPVHAPRTFNAATRAVLGDDW